jgi:hypothetical protein
MYFRQTNSNDKKVVACFDIDQLNEDEELGFIEFLRINIIDVLF